MVRPSRPLSTLITICLPFLAIANADAQTRPPFQDGWAAGTPRTVTGALTVLAVDDFENRRADLMHIIRDERTGESFQLRFERSAPAGLSSDAKVRVAGRVRGNELYVAGCCEGSTTSSWSPLDPNPNAPALATGEQRTLVMLANFRDAAVSCTADAINNAMFADPTGLSVNELYRASSFGRLSFSGQVIGPYALDASTTDACNMSGWADVMDAAASTSGVDVASYPRKVYVMPPNTCPGAGLGTVGSVQSSRAWIFACGTKGVFAHEIGHNLGMDHSATPTQEYGDNTDPMAIASWMLHGVNAPHRLTMGWFEAADAQLVNTSGVYDVGPLATDPAQATVPRTLLIRKPDTADYYYLSYRTPIGSDKYIDSTYYYRLSVHQYRSDGTLQKTYLLAGLADGQSFVDSVNGITITQVTHGDTRASVRIEFADTCVQSVPVVGISPQAQSAAAGTTVGYTLSITNVASSSCPANAFALGDSAPVGWTMAIAPSTLTLISGETGQADVTLTSPSAAAIGTYTAMINAAGQVGTGSVSSTTVTYAVQAPQDSVAPTAPTQLAAVPNQTLKRIELTWKAATDNVGVAGYRIFKNASLAGTSPTPSWIDQAWSSGASYTYSVAAFDAAGNVSAVSNSVTVVLSGGAKKR